MTPERWQHVKDVLAAVLEVDASERQAHLENACGDDLAMRREIESLLAMGTEGGSDILSVPVDVSREGSAANTRIGRRIGPYQVVGEIGAGGMGEVYRAIRADDQYQKHVAIKLVRAGQDSGFVISRFKNERQILASLDHPNIARLLDGGTTEDGLPYFVMELIEGQPIDEYCSEHKLSVSERLNLFLLVCSAVQYAHQRLIIHRDIKPGNILVTSDGTPKLLDFGIAKLLNADAVEGRFEPTLTIFRVLTPGYASPEQVKGEPITTASDVYSLGVVLYELLAGRHPYRRDNSTPQEIARAVCEAEPEKPSAAVRKAENDEYGPGTSRANPAMHRDFAEKLSKKLRGDLDNILLMALRKEPQRRYVSVEQFAEDIRRHLENLPVIARKDTARYRTAKFISRHKAGVFTAAAVALILFGALAVTFREARIAEKQATVAREQRARAEQHFKDVRGLANSLIFDINDSIQDLPGSTHARELVLSNALKYLDGLAQESTDDASLQRELATAYERVGDLQGKVRGANLGDIGAALESYHKAQAIREKLVDKMPEDRVAYARNLRMTAQLQYDNSDASSALSSMRSALSITEARSRVDPTNREVLAELAADHSALGFLLEESRNTENGVGQTRDSVIEHYREALQIDQKLASASKDTSGLHQLALDEFRIGRHLRDGGDRKAAIEAFKDALRIVDGLASSAISNQFRRDIGSIHDNLADTFLMDGNAEQALVNYQVSLRTAKTLQSEDPKNVDGALIVGEDDVNIGSALTLLGRAAEALNYFNAGVAIFEKGTAAAPRLEGANYDLAVAYVWRASVLATESDFKAALEDYGKALDINQRFTKTNPDDLSWRENTSAVHTKIGDFFRRNGQPDNATKHYRESLAVVEPLLAKHPDHQDVLYVLSSTYFGLAELTVDGASRRSVSGEEQIAAWKRAKSFYELSLDLWKRIAHPGPVSPNGFAYAPAPISRRLNDCDVALRALMRNR